MVLITCNLHWWCFFYANWPIYVPMCTSTSVHFATNTVWWWKYVYMCVFVCVCMFVCVCVYNLCKANQLGSKNVAVGSERLLCTASPVAHVCKVTTWSCGCFAFVATGEVQCAENPSRRQHLWCVCCILANLCAWLGVTILGW